MGQAALLESFQPNFGHLRDSLEKISLLGLDYFYKYTFGPGTATKNLEIQVKKKGGTLSVNDLTGYLAKIRQPFVKQLAGFTFLTPPPPSLGFIIPISLGILNSSPQITLMSDAATFYRFSALSVKIALMQLETILEEIKDGDWETSQTYKKLRDDPDYLSTLGQKLESEDLQAEIWTGSDAPLFYKMESNMNNSSHCGNSVHVLSPGGDGVSVSFGTTTFFGAGFASETTGTIFNSAMKNFRDGIGANAGARLLSPLSSLTVLNESGNLRLQVSGIGGGIAGLAGAVMATYRHLWLKELPYEAVSSPVVIPNLKTPSIVHESKMDKKLLDDAWNGPTSKMPDEFVFGVDMIARVKGKVKPIYAYVDRRKGKDAFASGR